MKVIAFVLILTLVEYQIDLRVEWQKIKSNRLNPNSIRILTDSIMNREERIAANAS